MDEIIAEFIEETHEALGDLDIDLVKLEKDPSNEELVGKIFRLMHTIKGTCGFLNLSRLESVAHVAENLLDHFRNHTIPVDELTITHILVSIDRVRLLIDQIEKNGKESEGSDQDIISGIQSIITQYTEANKEETPEPNNENITPNDAISVPADTETAQQRAQTETSVDAAAPTDQTASTAPVEKAPEYLRVQMGLLEEIVNMVSELVLTRNQLFQQMRHLENHQCDTTLERLNRTVSDLQDKVMKTRMQPIGNAWTKLPRIVRDISVELHKDIELKMTGEDTELDRQVLEMIKDPLTHMIRNSCDHGIEAPEERDKAGKKPKGTIHLDAHHEGGFIIIKIEDDGNGIDPQKIAQKAIEKGLLDEDKAASLSDKELLNYIMAPGFSTAQTVTNISGRGVGMDVVQQNIEHIGGTIEIDSVPGKKSVFTIHIPLTLAIISALIIEIENQRYAIPQMNIKELVSYDHTKEELIEYIDHKPVLRLRNRIIPLLDSKTMLNGTLTNSEENEHIDDQDKSIVVMSAGSTHYGIIVDKIYDIEEIVIKSISKVLNSTKIYAGNTILGDGSVIMILDPGAIAREYNVEKDLSKPHDNDEALTANSQTKQQTKMLLFKTDKESVKALPLELVSRLQEFSSADISFSDGIYVVKHDGKLIQLCQIDSTKTELEHSSLPDTVLALIFSDDQSDASLGLMVNEIVDISESEGEINTSTAHEGVIGTALFGDTVADIIDITHYMKLSRGDWYASQSHAYISFNGSTETLDAANDDPATATDHTDHTAALTELKQKSLRILAVDDSNFFRNVLKPMLLAAGFNVIVCASAKEAIALHDDGEMFDLIISDIEMPEMNGYEFVEQMKTESSWKQTPFVALTSHQTPEDIQKGKEKGFSSYVGKLDKDILMQGIIEALSTSQQQEAG